MRTKQSLELDRLKALRRRGKPVFLANIAILHRDLGNYPRAFHWWKKAASGDDGDSWVDVGYCLQYGIGVRQDLKAARRAYQAAIHSDCITEYGAEEARYHLALLLLDHDGLSGARQALSLLRAASRDGDYPEASWLLRGVTNRAAVGACRCRRGLRKRLGAQVACPQHRVAGRRKIIVRRAGGPTSA